MALSNKQLAFVNEYLVDFNATQAAIRAGYSERSAYSIGWENLRKPEIIAAVREKAMSAEEVLMRLSDIARGDFADIFDITQLGFVIDLAKAKENDKTKLIKKIKQRTTITTRGDEETEIHDIEVELYSAQEALNTLGKYHKLFVERQEITGADGGALEVIHIQAPEAPGDDD